MSKSIFVPVGDQGVLSVVLRVVIEPFVDRSK